MLVVFHMGFGVGWRDRVKKKLTGLRDGFDINIHTRTVLQMYVYFLWSDQNKQTLTYQK